LEGSVKVLCGGSPEHEADYEPGDLEQGAWNWKS